MTTHTLVLTWCCVCGWRSNRYTHCNASDCFISVSLILLSEKGGSTHNDIVFKTPDTAYSTGKLLIIFMILRYTLKTLVNLQLGSLLYSLDLSHPEIIQCNAEQPEQESKWLDVGGFLLRPVDKSQHNLVSTLFPCTLTSLLRNS